MKNNRFAPSDSNTFKVSFIRNQIIHIDSFNRLSTSTSNEDFKISMPNLIDNITQIIPISAEIPLTFYMVNSSTNVISVTDSTPTTYTVTLTNGNYSGSELATQIQTKLNTAFAGFTVTYDSKTGKFTFANASTFNLKYTASTSKYLIGLTADSGLVASYTSTNVANLLGYRFLYIISPELAYREADMTESYTGRNIFMKIPIDGAIGSLQVFYPKQPILIESNQNSIKNVNIQLVDESFNVISLNGIPWSFSFQLVTQTK